jgi:predicted nucleotidyltransferase
VPRIRSKPVLDIKVATLSGLVVLKLISWEDRSYKDKDARDLDYIITNYLEAGNRERLYSENEDILVEYDFEYELSGAGLLGRDISKEVNQETKAALLEILDRETDETGQFRLAIQMAGARSTAQDDFEKKLDLIKALKKGISES